MVRGERGAGRRLLLFLLLSPVALLSGEGFVRVFLPQEVDNVLNIFRADPTVGYLYLPNATASETGREYRVTYTTNSLGLRDHEYGLKRQGVVRVLLFGDSFSETHGLSLEQSLSKQIERHLREEADGFRGFTSVEVVNVSFGGYSPYHYWKSYARWKSILSPDLVVVGFYTGNDFVCEPEGIQYQVADGKIVGAGDSPANARGPGLGASLRDARKWCARTSELYVLLRNFFYYNDVVGRVAKRAGGGGPADPLGLFLRAEAPGLAAERARCFQYLSRLAEEATADGVGVALATIPTKLEIDSDLYRRTLIAGGHREADVDLDKPYAALAAFCRAVGIAYLDTRPALREANVRQPCYYEYDGHWNARGVDTAAAAIVRAWRAASLPPFGESSSRCEGVGLGRVRAESSTGMQH